MRRGRVANSDADFDWRVIRFARRQRGRHDAAGSRAAHQAGRLGKLKTTGRRRADLDLEDDRPTGAENLADVDCDGVDRLASLGRPTEPETGLLADRPSSEAFGRAPAGPGHEVALPAAEGQRTVERRQPRRDIGRQQRFDLVGAHSESAKISERGLFSLGEQAIQAQPQHAHGAPFLAVRPRQQPAVHYDDFRFRSAPENQGLDLAAGPCLRRQPAAKFGKNGEPHPHLKWLARLSERHGDAEHADVRVRPSPSVLRK
jgi:hypothetical protein